MTRALGDAIGHSGAFPRSSAYVLNLIALPANITSWTEVLGPVYQGRSETFEEELVTWESGGRAGAAPTKPMQRGGSMRAEQSENELLKLCQQDIALVRPGYRSR